ncbi:MAG: succinyl-coa synthetase alpha subunit related protein [Promethearchaeota archaeon CR_4]|nr:MAG: succinyl-coa synthetase alpha subunit related protein [Candidatus Lokiarchaeota archaeon CR_4]
MLPASPVKKEPSHEGHGNLQNRADLHTLFYPKNIAVIGVSHNPVSGIKYIKAHEVSGFPGGLYPINPKYSEIDGRKIYPSLDAAEVPEIDMAIIAVPAPNVPAVIRDCHKKKVKFAVIFTSGFAESGREDLDQELRQAIADGPTRVVGPNGLGVYNQESRVNFLFKRSFELPGNISYIAQSGGTTARLLMSLQTIGVGMQNAVSAGNMLDVSMADFLRYFRDEVKTKVVVLYMENVRDGRDFLAALRETTRVKPVIIWKSGQSDIGATAARSHTGSLAGSYQIWESALRQHGAIIAENFEEMRDFAAALSINQTLPNGNRIGIVVSGGGVGVEITDVVRTHNLEVPELTLETQRKLAEFIPDINSSFRNPVDLGEYGYVPHYYGRALKIITEDPNVDVVVTVREPERSPWFEESMNIKDIDNLNILALKIAMKVGKPIYMNLSPNSDLPEHHSLRYAFRARLIKEIGVPTIDYTPHVAKLLQQLVRYKKYLQQYL